MDATLFTTGHLSRVTGVALADGREVVVKVRPWSPRLPGCHVVQTGLWSRGFCCPEPLTAVERIGDEAWSAEAHVGGGHQVDPDRPGAAAVCAALLDAMLTATRDVKVGPTDLLPTLPWVGWDHAGQGLWPERDDVGPSIADFRGPAWLDEAADAARQFLLSATAGWPRLAGHGDFESQNIRWQGETPLVVHDWDSAICQPESVIVGAASAVWAAAGQPGQASTVQQSRDFLTAYQQLCDEPWSELELRAAWAAGIWVRAFNAKKDAADGGGPNLASFRAEAPERLRRAGLR